MKQNLVSKQIKDENSISSVSSDILHFTEIVMLLQFYICVNQSEIYHNKDLLIKKVLLQECTVSRNE